jgi:hypothetical protein
MRWEVIVFLAMLIFGLAIMVSAIREGNRRWGYVKKKDS